MRIMALCCPSVWGLEAKVVQAGHQSIKGVSSMGNLAVMGVDCPWIPSHTLKEPQILSVLHLDSPEAFFRKV